MLVISVIDFSNVNLNIALIYKTLIWTGNTGTYVSGEESRILQF